MKKILVLGGNGFIGKYIVEKLSENDNNQIIIADYNIDGCENTPNIEYKKIDFIECQNFDEYLKNVDIVIHLISTIVPSDNNDNINKEISDNVFPTIRLLDSMLRNRTQKIVFLSSGGTVYGEHDLSPIKEEEEKNPICNYGITKLLIEKYLELYNKCYGLNYNVVRLANPYSEKIKNGKKQGIIPIVIDQILKDETITVWGDGEDVRDYIYIEDAIEAILKIMEYNGEEKIFNVGTGIGVTINELLNFIKINMDVDNIKIQYTRSRKCDVRNNVLDISKLKKELNWEPKVGINEGIEKVIEAKGKSR